MASSFIAIDRVVASRSSAFNLSYKNVSFIVAVSEALTVVFSSVASRLLYVTQTGSVASGIDVSIGTGVFLAALYIYLMQSAGLYNLDNIVRPSRVFRKLCVYSIISALSLTATFFMLKSGSLFSRGTFTIIVVLQLVGLLSVRLVAGALVKKAITNCSITGRPAMIIGSAEELECLEGGYLLKQFGFSEVGCLSITTDDLDKGHVIDAAINQARQTRAEAFIIAERWSDKKRLTAIKNV